MEAEREGDNENADLERASVTLLAGTCELRSEASSLIADSLMPFVLQFQRPRIHAHTSNDSMWSM